MILASPLFIYHWLHYCLDILKRNIRNIDKHWFITKEEHEIWEQRSANETNLLLLSHMLYYWCTSEGLCLQLPLLAYLATTICRAWHFFQGEGVGGNLGRHGITIWYTLMLRKCRSINELWYWNKKWEEKYPHGMFWIDVILSNNMNSQKNKNTRESLWVNYIVLNFI